MSDPLTRVPGIWRAGMLVDGRAEGYGVYADGHIRVVAVYDGLPYGLVRATECEGSSDHYEEAPIDVRSILLDDPHGATTGCLAAFCRELYGQPGMYAMPLASGGWCVLDKDSAMVGYGRTESATWRAATLAHPSLKDVR